MNFKEYNRNQSLLLPPSYEVFLGESHEAVVLAEFIDSLNLISLESEYGNEHGGRSAYHPIMLLTVLIYAYMNGIFSSRKIAKCLRQDLAYMYLAGNSTPDFRTLARFRKEKGVCLTTAFKEVVTKAREFGFITFGTVSLDGTKIYANASKTKNEPRTDALEEKIGNLVKEAKRVDDEEDNMYGDHEDCEEVELKTKKGRMKKRQELKKKRNVNTTDPDARLMKMKHGDFANGYNVQIMTEHGLVLTSHIADSSADQNLLVPTVQAFKKIHTVLPKLLLADKGYSGEANYRFCEEEHINAYIPIHKEPVDLTQYVYDKARDTYMDVMGRIYRFKQHMNRNKNEKHPLGRPKKGKGTQHYTSTVYEYVDTVTKKKKYLSIAHEWQRYAREQKEKLTSLRGQKIYKRRMSDVEPAFANIKHNLRFTSFRLRGFSGVTNEWNLISIAHNFKRMF